MDKALQQASRRVLVIDDNPAIHEDYRKILAHAGGKADALSAMESALFDHIGSASERPRFSIDTAEQGQEGVARLAKALERGETYALAFVDMRMPPGWDGLETIEHLWALDPDLQVVICSAHSDNDWGDIIARVGHSDNLLILKKPFEPIVVQQCAGALTRKWFNERRVRGQLDALELTVRARTEGMEAAMQQLQHLATHDALTGLPNRVLLEDRLNQAIAQSQRHGNCFSVLMVDLDRFKSINDTLGHGAGDALLCETARRLVGVVRDGDTVARLGGDEFVMVINPIATSAESVHIAQRAIEALRPAMSVAGREVHTSPSIGIAYYPADGDSVDTLLARADAAMYCAKQRGRNNAQCFEAGMDTQTLDKVRLESELHEALALEQFELLYQPKVDIKSGAVHSAEARLRWCHPMRGMLAAQEFMQLAEGCGLTAAIGRWVLQSACRQASAWQKAGLPAVRIAVHLAGSQFRHPQLLTMIREALQDAELAPRYLEVELDESSVLTAPAESIAILEQLSSMGVVVSVGDFGSGYSSMSYLRRFPIDKLTINRHLINEILSRPDDASIVRAIVALAHALRLKVVAEGVETEAQLALLKTLGCDQYQGCESSTPVDAATFQEVLLEQRNRHVQPAELERTHSRLSAYRRP